MNFFSERKGKKCAKVFKKKEIEEMETKRPKVKGRYESDGANMGRKVKEEGRDGEMCYNFKMASRKKLEKREKKKKQ